MSPPQTDPLPRWKGISSTSILPTDDYWEYLGSVAAGRQLDALRAQSDRRVGELSPGDLPPPADTATALLDRLASDGWIERKRRHTCPRCGAELDGQQCQEFACPHCGEVFSQQGEVTTETVYVRALAPSRDVEWVIALHGMNTRGAWQEEFSWHLATTWGRSVPVAVYKYGIVIPGVIMPWRRRALLQGLRLKLVTLRDQARAQDFHGNPDVVAHSFGTWLLGHLLLGELRRPEGERLRFGRVILAGCVLRPDFDWATVKGAGLVEEVLNHYGTKDAVVPMAHCAIWDSGPSGRRGFDDAEVANLRAEGYGHSDLLSTTKWVVDDQPRQKHRGEAAESHLEHTYRRFWRPFLVLPTGELSRLPGCVHPGEPWRRLPWPLRGTLFPVVVLTLAASLAVLLGAGLGKALLASWPMPWATVAASAAGLARALAGVSAGGLLLLLVSIGGTTVWRRIRSWRRSDVYHP
jgi:hypothetical protein